jgi:hypothetical protein
MIAKILVSACLSAAFSLSIAAQEASTKIKLRALLHDPLKPFAEMYVMGEEAKLVRLNLALEGLTAAQIVTTNKGVLHLFSSDHIDPQKPLEHLIATATVSETIKQAVVLIVPAAAGEKIPYRLMVIDDSFATFPKGESRAINMTRQPLALRVGEHSKEIPGAAVVGIPPVTKVNHMNQAQTNFYIKQGDEWVILSERPLQYTNDVRRLFLIYQMPNVDEPQIRTILDTSSP